MTSTPDPVPAAAAAERADGEGAAGAETAGPRRDDGPRRDGQRDRPRPDRAQLTLWLALVVALVGLTQTGTPTRISMLALILVAVVLAASLRWRIGWLAIVVLFGVGIALRLGETSGFSDVLVVTEAAIREMLGGGNPYGHGYQESVPPGAPFAYGPLSLVWYLPSLEEPVRMELLASFLVLGALAVRGQPLGLAIYAVMPALVVAASRYANDTTAGLLILVALLVAARSPGWGGALLGLAVAFKPYALAWLPPLLGFAGISVPLVGFLIASAVAWLPALLAFGPEAMLWSFRRADEIHAQAYYSLAYGLGSPEGVPRDAWQAVRIGSGLVLAVISLFVVRSAASMVIMGALIFGATLFLGWWGTFAYVSAVAPIVCWHLDAWLGLDRGRVVWPGDPVAALSRWVDARWPVRQPRAPVIGT